MRALRAKSGWIVASVVLAAASTGWAKQGGEDDGSGKPGGADKFFTEIKAPLEAVNCGGTPPTITVLGLVIDISAAEIRNDIDLTTGCASLEVGKTVEVEFGSDLAPLAALEVTIDPDKQGKLEIQGPLQAIDTSGMTVQILGLTIDVSTVELKNISSLDALELSQIVEIDLVSATGPLAAESLLRKKGSFVKSLKLTTNFAKPDRDAVSLSGAVQLSSGFTPNGKAVVLDVGGQVFNFTLDDKGNAVVAEGKFSLKQKTGRAEFKARLKNGDFQGSWVDEGVVDGDFKKEPLEMDVALTIDGVPYGGTVQLEYSAKAGRLGKAK